jgi:hypothetical protein
VLLLASAALVAAGCGGGGTKQGGGSTREAGVGATPTSTCSARGRTRALARLRADVAALRRAAGVPTKDTLGGSAAVNRATDRFLHDVAVAPVDNLVRNRMIDHAAAALVGACEQCFQALEAARPIPAIAHGDRGCTTP